MKPKVIIKASGQIITLVQYYADEVCIFLTSSQAD